MCEQNENLKSDKKHKKAPNRCHRIEVYNKFFKKKLRGSTIVYMKQKDQ